MTTRDVLVSAVRARLIDRGSPRLVTLLILTLSGAVAFATSVGALRLGVDTMAHRYPLATIAGYLTFIVLIRVWIALHRDEDLQPEAERISDGVLDGSELLPRDSGGQPDPGFDLGLDVDELWFVAIAAACALAGLVAIAYVVYIAPVLLAEVALDAALVSTVYRRLRREDARWWATSVLKRTWLPATALTMFMGVAGFAMQQIAPDARSIGGVIRELRE